MKRRKSLFRVSIRFSLVLIVMASLLMAHLAGHWQERRIEQEFVQRLTAKLKGSVRIDRESQVDRYLCNFDVLWGSSNDTAVVVDYRGPKFLKSLCQRLGIDVYDRITEVHLTRQPTTTTGLESLRSLQIATFSRQMNIYRPATRYEDLIPQLERSDAVVYVYGPPGRRQMDIMSSHQVVVVFGNVPLPKTRPQLIPLADYRTEHPAGAMDPFGGLPTVKASESHDTNTLDGHLGL